MIDVRHHVVSRLLANTSGAKPVAPAQVRLRSRNDARDRPWEVRRDRAGGLPSAGPAKVKLSKRCDRPYRSLHYEPMDGALPNRGVSAARSAIFRTRGALGQRWESTRTDTLRCRRLSLSRLTRYVLCSRVRENAD